MVSTIPGPLKGLLNMCGADLTASGTKTRTWEDLLGQGREMEEVMFRVEGTKRKRKDESVAIWAYFIISCRVTGLIGVLHDFALKFRPHWPGWVFCWVPPV